MLKGKIVFNRNELSGAFGDIGTDFPLIMGMILINNLDPASTLIMFGAMQVFTAFMYGIPMAVQPFKAMATIMLTQRLSKDLLYAAGFSLGLVMLILSITGLLDKLANCIPKAVIRGIQFGLGISLASLGLRNYVLSEGIEGYILAALSFSIIMLLLGNRKFPPAIIVIIIGILYALIFHVDISEVGQHIKLATPQMHGLTLHNIILGFLLLGLPQIPLSLGNSIFATKQTITDFFPEKKVTVRKIGITYSIMNLINPFFSGIPTCHGAGGLSGHYAFGARTGGSLVIYGSMYIFLGLFLNSNFSYIAHIFPMPMLGIILFFEGVFLMRLIQDIMDSKKDLLIVLMIGIICLSLQYGYVIGIIAGILIYNLDKLNIIKLIKE